MKLALLTIPDVDVEWEQTHRIRALAINGKSPVLDVLARWKASEKSDYKKILKVMERVARLDRIRDEKHVKAQASKSGVFEMRAHRGNARVLFCYDDDVDGTAICLHTHWKGSGNQTTAFRQAEAMMKLWRSSSPRKN